jgi:hypothetical protein
VSDAAYLPPYRRPRWNSRGLTPRQERAFDLIAFLLVTVIMAGWAVSILEVRKSPAASEVEQGPMTAPQVRPGARVGSALTDPRATSTAYLNEAALKFGDPLRGHSGRLNAVFRTPGEPVTTTAPDDVAAAFEGQEGEWVISPDLSAPENPGVYKVAVEFAKMRRGIDGLRLITLVPFSQKRGGRIGPYFLGSWPYESGETPKSRAYAPPRGFIEVTPQNADLYVSEHFRLRDFLTKDQRDVWPKYLLLDPRLLDKLELMIEELKKEGYDVRHVTVMSGFRTPRYNHSGGNTAGRANLSRHMYGDGADVFVDNDRNGWTDDINKDGKVDTKDAEIMAAAAERVEKRYPALVGGIAIYPACCGHGPFIHLDIRGYPARWRGTGKG